MAKLCWVSKGHSKKREYIIEWWQKKNNKLRRKKYKEEHPVPIPQPERRKNKNRFEEGDCKKIPLVIFGDGLKNKGHVRQLKHREGLGELLLLDINEYKALKTCNSCLNQDLQNPKCRRGDDIRKIHQVLKCSTCNIFWNRDVMAAKNMLLIAPSIWNGQGRPNVFKRQIATSNVVASSHSGAVLA
ncbi:hypothetical protein BCV72DRAFT_260756 [Rhizopus microsporus var. microsporus]|uniref:Transposase n=2 Tax=Rhizopus microsporus TaxID=58291 RepID=A0A2G4T9C2_RHIZD|nr:uncharacterized protein RHIMIDRAFT_310277 [Rhizopus microsporus ATCC 52813]ORE09475.1 hypothetical protein BCV72DRAFT_260756 [Rhizopus microsporus var. microsporus]PHZ17609.1 hypothetical protein RHIMIDRAFT_310277 [Rhizopus microsporus ATCC 52813]